MQIVSKLKFNKTFYINIIHLHDLFSEIMYEKCYADIEIIRPKFKMHLLRTKAGCFLN